MIKSIILMLKGDRASPSNLGERSGDKNSLFCGGRL